MGNERGTTRMGNLGRIALGLGSIGVCVYWAGLTVPALAERVPEQTVQVEMLTEEPFVNDIGLVEASLGCADGLSSADLHRFFGEQRGPLLGWDNPHVIELGPQRWLWLNHDTYIDYDGAAPARTLHDGGAQNQNVALEQTGTCFSMLHRGTPNKRLNFEVGDGHVDRKKFLWPLGGEVDGDVVKVFWAETIPSVPQPSLDDGIARHPTMTWLAQYDLESLERLSFAPAPNSGVDPIYGFAVASDEEHSYLFGNTNLLNFAREGGYANGPHSATKMYLARVPRGQLEQQPEYWDGSGWTDDASLSGTISSRFYAENTMQPRFVDGRWVSVVKADGFHGADVLIDVADDPWGPWVTVDRRFHVGRQTEVWKNSYQPIILPWSSAEAGITVVMSENAVIWEEAVANPPLYRPAVFRFPWPVELDGVDDAAIVSEAAQRRNED